MTFNSTDIIQEIQTKVLAIIEDVTGNTADQMTACDAEKDILSSMLSLGASFLSLFYQNQASRYASPTTYNADGVELPLHSWKKRQQLSLFGPITIERTYYYHAHKGSHFPLDHAINLAPAKYSDCVQELYAELAVEQAYQSGNAFMQRWLNLSVSSRAVQDIVAETGNEVTAFYDQASPPEPERQESILVVQADGKGVPQIKATEANHAVRPKRGQARSHKKEAIVTTVYSIAPRPRTTEAIIASLFKESGETPPSDEAKSRVKPIDKQLWATLEGKEIAMNRLKAAATERDSPQIEHRVALCDGDKSLQARFTTYLEGYRLMLDFIHAYEYLWKAANLIFDETDPNRVDWIKTQTIQLLNSQTKTVIDHLRHQAALYHGLRQEKLLKISNYFERNLSYMDYASCLALGLPIASGVIEGACRHIVKDRMELSGMRWSSDGAETLLQLRCVKHNQDWDKFWHYHRQLRQQQSSTPALTDLPLAV